MTSGAHLSQELIQRIADLEIDGVHAHALAHAESCAACSERIADAALATLRVHDVVVAAAELPAAAPAPSPVAPMIIAVLVAAFASLPLASDWLSRITHVRLVWEAAVRMLEPVWTALASPRVQIAATTSAVLLCLILVMSLARPSRVEVKS